MSVSPAVSVPGGVTPVTAVTDLENQKVSKVTAASADCNPVTGDAETGEIEAAERPCWRVHARPFRMKYDPPELKRPAGVYRHYSGKPKGKDDTPVPEEFRICAPLWVRAISRSEDQEHFGLVLEFIDRDGRRRTWPIPYAMLAGDSAALQRELFDAGLEIVHRRRDKIAEYIADAMPKLRVVHVTRTGWLRDRSAFVLPKLVIGRDDVVLQTENAVPEHAPGRGGDFAAWREHVAAPAEGNPALALMLASSLSAPLYGLLDVPPGGVHMFGDSSGGKTSCLFAAASVWGRGEAGFVRTWNGTANGLEAVASLCSDIALCLDELGVADGAAVATIVYSLLNGCGRLRAKVTGAARRATTWRSVVISTGERPLIEHMRAAGIEPAAGQRVRLLDIPAGGEFGVFDRLHDFASGAELADALRAAARMHYGHAGPAFVELALRRREDLQKLFQGARACFDPRSAVEQRAADRFALAALAGEMANEAGILPWPAGEATRAAQVCFDRWRDALGVSTAGPVEDAQIIEAVRAFLDRNEAQFSALLDTETVVRDRAGWWREDARGRVWFVLVSAIPRIVPGFPRERVYAALQRRRWLAEIGRDGTRTKVIKVASRTVRVLVLREPSDD